MTRLKFTGGVFFAALFLPAIMLLEGCATIWIPKKQAVTIFTDNPEAVVMMGTTQLGEGEKVRKRIEKDGARQITVYSPNCKPDYYVVLPAYRPVVFWLAQPLNVMTIGYGYFFDFYFEKNKSYKRKHHFNRNNTQLIQRNAQTDKFVDFNEVWMDSEDHNLRFISAQVKATGNRAQLQKRMEAAEQKAREKALKEKKVNLVTKKITIVNGPYTLGKDQEKNTASVKEVLRLSGFTDSSNSIFCNPFEVLYIKAQLMSGVFYNVENRWGDQFSKMKLETRWYVANQFDELVDSIDVVSYSGEIHMGGSQTLQDALANSFLLFQETPVFQKYIKKSSSSPTQTGEIVKLLVKDTLNDPGKAKEVSVIIQTPTGHGSGFVVSNDGHIVTNYHVIASGRQGNYGRIFVTDAKGIKFEAKVVTVNRAADLALLKIENNFDYCVKLSQDKTYAPTQKVFTVGTPLSMELSHSITQGVISGDRDAGHMVYVQLNLAVSPGSSGGPLFDEQCRLQGVMVSKLISKDAEGICFAIPGYQIMNYLNLSY